VRGIFDGFRPKQVDQQRSWEGTKEDRADVRRRAVERHARAIADVARMRDKGLPVLPHQRDALERAREALDGSDKGTVRDLERAYARDPRLAAEAADGRTARAIRAMQLETEIRADPEKRADRFVENWRKLDSARLSAYRNGDNAAMHRARDSMGAMAKSLERDPQMESLLRTRKPELGIEMPMGRTLRHDLISSIGIDMGRGLGR